VSSLGGAAGPASAPGVSPARVCAFAVIRRVFEHGAYADRALSAEAAGLEPRERSLAMALSFGTVQRLATLDHVAARLSSRPLDSLDAPVLAALRLGLFQILLLDGVADHAAVNESVELAKRHARGGAGLVNAVLRRATRDGAEILGELDDRTPESAAVLHSAPIWLARLWWRELGPERARSVLGAINDPAESALRVNTLVSAPEDVTGSLPVRWHGAAELPEAIVTEEPFDAQSSELYGRGAIFPQSRASMLVSRVLAPAAGERVLDLCAAPGAKTTHLAALMENEGELVAIERHPGRAAALARTLERMHVERAAIRVGDAADPGLRGRFDRVLLDPPCSGLGTLQSRPDLRWRTSPERISELSSVQARMLDAAAAVTAPGGVLVYSVCTISTVEGERQVEAFLERQAEFAADELAAEYGFPPAGPHLQLMPDRDGTDGFFIARVRRLA
jgi:16S rRNA (cytosine967-C5)-methyltransferase